MMTMETLRKIQNLSKKTKKKQDTIQLVMKYTLIDDAHECTREASQRDYRGIRKNAMALIPCSSHHAYGD